MEEYRSLAIDAINVLRSIIQGNTIQEKGEVG